MSELDAVPAVIATIGAVATAANLFAFYRMSERQLELLARDLRVGYETEVRRAPVAFSFSREANLVAARKPLDNAFGPIHLC